MGLVKVNEPCMLDAYGWILHIKRLAVLHPLQFVSMQINEWARGQLACVRACMRACVCVCMRACVCVCVCVCVCGVTLRCIMFQAQRGTVLNHI